MVATRDRQATENVLVAFDEHLRRARGVCAGTRRNYRRYAHAFLKTVFVDGPVDVAAIRAGDVAGFVGDLTRRYRPGTVGLAALALRSFFRFLRAEGLRGDRLEDAVPMVPHRPAGLVRHLEPGCLERLIVSLDSCSSRGLRDRAIILCVARLGLRASEVAQLRLDDLDWRNATVRVRARKTCHGALLPLTAEVGTAVADYLRHGRPETSARHVFVLHWLRAGAPISSSIVGRAVDNALQRAGMDAPIRGANLLRHSLATDLTGTSTILIIPGQEHFFVQARRSATRPHEKPGLTLPRTAASRSCHGFQAPCEVSVSDKGSMTPSAAQIRRVNADTVYAAMPREGASTASELMALTGLTRPTVHAACEWLISQGLVEEIGGAGPQESQPGRPAKRYRVIGDAGYVIALEIRETAVAVAVADLTGRILDERAMEIAPDPEFDSQGSVHGPAVIRAALEKAGIRDDRVWQVCVSVPAPVHATPLGDDPTRRHRNGARQLIEHLRDALPWPLAAENDANLAMLGELWQGVAQGADSAVLLDICQHGFGAGLIVNGDLVRGKNGVAGEMSAVDLFSDMGPAGGVLEKARVLGARYVAGGGEPDSVLVARSGGDPAKITARIVFDAAQAGDPYARSIVNQLGAVVARPIAMLSTLLDPELIVLYGMDDEVADFLEPVIRSRTAELFDKQFESPVPRLERSRLGSRGSLVGGVRRALLEVEGRLFESPLAQASRPAVVARA